MDQFVSIPRQLYEQKIKLSPQRMDKYHKKEDSLPKNLRTVYKKVNAKTKYSRNESLSMKLYIHFAFSYPFHSIFLNERDTNVAFVDFVYALKRKNVDCPDIFYTILDAIGSDPHKIINRDAKSKEGSWILFQIWKSQAREVAQGRKSRIWFSSKPSES